MNAASKTRARETSLAALLDGIAKVPAHRDCAVRGLSLDSRRVRKDELFIAVPGGENDGRDYIKQAVRKGAAAIVRERTAGGGDEVAVPCFDIVGLKNRIGIIAERFFGAPSSKMQLIGITGTNGKTTCAYLLAQALTELGKKCALFGTIGSGFVGDLQSAALTTPDAITVHHRLAELSAEGARAVCMEVSSHGLQQGRVNGAAFDVAVLTNLTRDHLDYHRDMQRYGAAKRKLFRFPGLHSAVVNADDIFGRQLAGEHLAEQCITFGETGGDLRARNVRMDGDGIAFVATYNGQEARFRSPLIGKLNAPNLFAAAAALLACGYELPRAAEALAVCKAPPGRMQVLYEGYRDGWIMREGEAPAAVVDYAHTPDALAMALQSLRELVGGRVWVVFGCGGDRDRGKRSQMGAVAGRYADRIIITDDNPRHEEREKIAAHILAGIPKQRRGGVQVIHNRRQAIKTALTSAIGRDAVLVAGKGHETVQRVGRRALPMNDCEIVRAQLRRMPGVRAEGVRK